MNHYPWEFNILQKNTNELGPAWQNSLQETISFTDKRKSLSVIHIKEGLWRQLNNLKPLFSRNEELYVSKEVKENTLTSEGKSSVMPTRNINLRKSICVSRPLNMKLACKQALFYFSFRSFQKHHKSPAVYILSPALDGLWRQNRGSVNRLAENRRQTDNIVCSVKM